MHYKNLINTIKDRRRDLRISQETLSLLSGVSLRAIKNMESENGNPTISTLKKVGDVLGLSLHWRVKDLN